MSRSTLRTVAGLLTFAGIFLLPSAAFSRDPQPMPIGPVMELHGVGAGDGQARIIFAPYTGIGPSAEPNGVQARTGSPSPGIGPSAEPNGASVTASSQSIGTGPAMESNG